MDKRCGTCAYWGEVVGWSRDDAGIPQDVAECGMKIPSSYNCVILCDLKPISKRTDGTTCPCWKAKESEGE